MQNNCDNDHDLDQPRPTTTPTFSRSMAGSVVVGSSRSGSAGPKTRHAHSTSRRASWPSGNLYRQSTSRSTVQQKQWQRSPPSRLGVEESESAAALHCRSLTVGSGRSMREPSSAAVRERFNHHRRHPTLDIQQQRQQRLDGVQRDGSIDGLQLDGPQLMNGARQND